MVHTRISPDEILKSSWAFTQTHFGRLVALVSIPAGVSFIAALFQDKNNIFAIILNICALVLYVILQPVLIRLVQDPASHISIVSRYKAGSKYFWPVVWAGIIGLCVIVGSTALFFIPGIIVAVYTIVYSYSVVIDEQRGFAALTKSYEMVKGRWWNVLWNMLALIVICFIIFFVIGFLGGFFVGFFGGRDFYIHYGYIVIPFISAITSVIVIPFAVVYMVKLYEKLKSTSGKHSTQSFKKWCIAFLCIGIIAIGLLTFTKITAKVPDAPESTNTI